MSSRYIGLLTLLLLLSSFAASAEEEIGMEILDTCMGERRAMRGDPVSSVRYGLCLGYLKGVADTLNGTTFCLPHNLDTTPLTQRLKSAFLTYAADHGEALRLVASETVLPAFEQAFPCKK